MDKDQNRINQSTGDSHSVDYLDQMEKAGKAGDDEILVRARRIQSEIHYESQPEDSFRSDTETDERHKKADEIRNRHKQKQETPPHRSGESERFILVEKWESFLGKIAVMITNMQEGGKSGSHKHSKHSASARKKRKAGKPDGRLAVNRSRNELQAENDKEPVPDRPGYFETDSLLFKKPTLEDTSAASARGSANDGSAGSGLSRPGKSQAKKKTRRSIIPMALFKKEKNRIDHSSDTESLQYSKNILNTQDPASAASSLRDGQRPKKGGRARRILAQAIVCLLLVCAFTVSAGAGAVAAYYKAAATTINTDTENALRNANVVDADLVYDQDVVNILLIGADKRQDETDAGRSDTTMIATIDIKNGKLKLTSLMRDMYIDIPGYGYHKFNAAYSYGGVQLEYETIAENFGIKLDGFVEVDMAAFREVVDLLGGVPMELTEGEAHFLKTAYVNSKHGEKDVTSGPNMLTPYQALAYCRIRQDVSGEFGRTDRQRKVLISIYDEMKKEDIMTITNICMRALRYVTTDLTEEQIRSLLTSVISMGSTEIEQLRIPYEGSYTAGRLGAGGAWIMETDYDLNSAALQYFIFGVGEDPQIEDEYGVGNDRFVDGYYPEKTEGISTY